MASRECAFTVTNGRISYGAELSAYGYQYDACNNLTKLTCSVLGNRWSTVYTYDGDNRASTTTLASGKVLTNTYDTLGRLQNRTLKQGNTTIHETALTYVPGSGTGATTGLVATYQNGSDAAYSYTYDDIGNITEITQGTTSIGYKYDTANRLIRENNSVTNQTVTYEYDSWGNILYKKTYAYTTGSLTNATYTQVSYGYTNTAWGDQLTSYAGQTITYDSMGNPTSYRGYTFGWRGKQLVSASNGTNTLTFEYNEDGLRQKKTVNNVDTDYFYNGSVLIGMQRGSTKYLFSYDAAGSVVSVRQIIGSNETEYYYVRNAQGDIVKIIDGSGNTVVQYTYDTWGKKVSTTGSLASTLGLFQPFRYRGYVYDYETGFYYLQSRYYDPTTGRFISADVLLSTGQGVLGYNCYAYCLGNPIRYKDNKGCTPEDDSQEDDPIERIRKTIKKAFDMVYLKSLDDGTAERHKMIDLMCKLLGTAYSSKHDCKWFASEIVGIRNSKAQEKLAGRHVDKAYNDFMKKPEKYSITVQATPSFGDMIFFQCPNCTNEGGACNRIDNIHHVGIYLEDDMMIDCGTNGVTVRSIYDVIPDNHGKYEPYVYMSY